MAVTVQWVKQGQREVVILVNGIAAGADSDDVVCNVASIKSNCPNIGTNFASFEVTEAEMSTYGGGGKLYWGGTTHGILVCGKDSEAEFCGEGDGSQMYSGGDGTLRLKSLGVATGNGEITARITLHLKG